MRRFLQWWATPPRRGWWDPRPAREWGLQYLINLALAVLVLVLVHAAGVAWVKASYAFIAALVVLALLQWAAQRALYQEDNHNRA